MSLRAYLPFLTTAAFNLGRIGDRKLNPTDDVCLDDIRRLELCATDPSEADNFIVIGQVRLNKMQLTEA